MDENNLKSRTQRKNEDRALQKLGERFVAVRPEELAALDLPEEFKEAVNHAREISSHGAKRRQMQRIGALMREITPSVIEKALNDISHKGAGKAYAIKKAESYCEKLKTCDQNQIDAFLNEYPDADRQRLSQLARNTKKSEESGPKKAHKSLLSYLAEVIQNQKQT